MSFIKNFLSPIFEETISEKVIPKEIPPSSNSYLSETVKSVNDNYSSNSFKETALNDSVNNLLATVSLNNNMSNNLVIEPPRTKSLTIASYFEDKGIEIILPVNKKTIAPVESLAFTIAINYPHTRPFIRFLRECITKKIFDFTYSLSTFSIVNKNMILSLAEKMNECGLISNYFYNKANGTIKGIISSAPKCINFINGDFLELYAKCVTVGVIKKTAEKHNAEHEFYHNVNIIKGSEKHELDIVFRIGNQVFWSEIKSGRFNPDEYRKLGILMGVVPDKLILLAADKSNDDVEAISYFYEYYCANISTFKNSLIEMIDKAFEEDKSL